MSTCVEWNLIKIQYGYLLPIDNYHHIDQLYNKYVVEQILTAAMQSVHTIMLICIKFFVSQSVKYQTFNMGII